MTLEEKAKAYDEAITIIRGNLDALNEITETGAEVVNIQSIKKCFYMAFPKLKESEDERIRKDVLAFIRREGQHIDKYKWHKWLAWLEKQGQNEQIPANSAKTCKDALSEEDDYNVQCCIAKAVADMQTGNVGRNNELIEWLKSLKERMNYEQKRRNNSV